MCLSLYLFLRILGSFVDACCVAVLQGTMWVLTCALLVYDLIMGRPIRMVVGLWFSSNT